MNFKRYVEASDTWVDSHYIKGTDTDTITTLPAIIYPLAQTATIGLKGNTVQNGTPSPSSPIMPEGTGERTGNLFDKSATDITNGYAIDYYLLITGETSQYKAWRISEYIPVSSNVNYYLKWDSRESIAATTPSICFYSSNKSYIGGINYNNHTGLTFTTPNNTAYIRFSFIQNQVDYIMLNEGSTALPYEPYGIKIPISSGDVTTPVYLGEVESTRRIKKLVLTGQETWYSSDTYTGSMYAYNSQFAGIAGNKPIYCSHLQYASNTSDYSIGKCCTDDNSVSLWIFDKTISPTSFKAYLADQYANGTPVTVWYVLAAEETGIVNEPLMKIGDYADSISGISIPTIAGANTLDVDTTVAPSEVTANYSGWHPVSSAHERDNGAWT